MVWVIIIAWITVVAALVVFVLRIAKGESLRRSRAQSFSIRRLRSANKTVSKNRSTIANLPRISGTAPAFIPQGENAQDELDVLDAVIETDHEVYINEESVVEMKAKKTSTLQKQPEQTVRAIPPRRSKRSLTSSTEVMRKVPREEK